MIRSDAPQSTHSTDELTVGADLESLQRDAFSHFLHETNPHNGLVRDKTAPDWPASIAATGLAVTAYPVAVERGFITRAAAVDIIVATLRFFWNSEQSPAPNATGHSGFYYHFLDMQTGRRAWQSELSTVDSAILIAGALTAAAYFDADTIEERDLRVLADALYRRADWPWAQNGGATVTHGWRPESGFLKWRWEGYDEALVLYILGLGSPTHPLPESTYAAWACDLCATCVRHRQPAQVRALWRALLGTERERGSRSGHAQCGRSRASVLRLPGTGRPVRT